MTNHGRPHPQDACHSDRSGVSAANGTRVAHASRGKLVMSQPIFVVARAILWALLDAVGEMPTDARETRALPNHGRPHPQDACHSDRSGVSAANGTRVAHASRVLFSASRGKLVMSQPIFVVAREILWALLDAVGESPTAARETRALPN